jgi:flavin reductase
MTDLLKPFKEGMSRLAGAVSIVATNGVHGKSGITATAISSVTDSPPTLLACVNRNSELNTLIKEHELFSVSLLAHTHQQLSGRFAGAVPNISHAERFLEGQWAEGELGQPVLADGLVTFECKLSALQEIGSHTVFFGEIKAVHVGNGEKPLIYFQRGYM